VIVHRYANGTILDVPDDAQFDEPAPGTVLVYIEGQAIQVTETMEEILRLKGQLK
jgi:hypothetical protein